MALKERKREITAASMCQLLILNIMQKCRQAFFFFFYIKLIKDMQMKDLQQFSFSLSASASLPFASLRVNCIDTHIVDSWQLTLFSIMIISFDYRRCKKIANNCIKNGNGDRRMKNRKSFVFQNEQRKLKKKRFKVKILLTGTH